MHRVGPALVVLAGCGSDGPDLTGTYRVDVHTVDATGCVDLVPVTDPPYVRFEQGEIFGRTYYSISACTDPLEVDCPGSGPYGPYADGIDDGWRAELGIAQTTGGCILDYTWSEAVLVDSQLVIDGRHHRDESDRPDAECTGELAVELGEAMPCAGAEHLEATRL